MHKLVTTIPAVRRSGTVLVLVLLAGCAASSGERPADFFEPLRGNPRIVMMPPDIRYYLMTAGGNHDLHEAWTTDAETNFAAAAMRIVSERGLDIPILERGATSDEILRYEGLHAVVGEAIMEHSMEANRLPAKNGNSVSDWTLGPGVKMIADATDADYALFVHYRENQASGGRLAFAILAAVAKINIPTGSEHGFASLVDLSTGDIAWFGTIYDNGHELREPEGASLIADWLLNELPVAGGFAGTLDAE